MSRDRDENKRRNDPNDQDEPDTNKPETIGGEDEMLTSQNDPVQTKPGEDEGKEIEEVTLDTPELGEDEAPPADEPELRTKEEEEEWGKRLKEDKVMSIGEDVPTLPGPSTVVVNRAAIVYLAKHLLVPPDLEDFKTAFPSLF